MTLPIFPRRGEELSTQGELLFPRGKYRHPKIYVEFENGDDEERPRTASGWYEFTITARVPDDDKIVIMEFITARMADRAPFTLEHPDFGTATAKYPSEDLPFEKVIKGTPPWWSFDIPIKARRQ